MYFIEPHIRERELWLFAVVSLGVGFFWFGQIWINLEKNHRAKDEIAHPSLGLPNSLTIIRGFLISLATGLILLPLPTSPVKWLPGILYLTAVILDGVDGIVARLRGKVTVLGEILDMEMDSLTVLIGAIAVFISGKGGFLILLVGTARYLFITAEWLLKRSARPVLPLPGKPLRRALAGLMMGFLAVSMFPVFYPPALRFISNFIAVPFLLGFLDDWCLISGFGLSWRQKVMELSARGLQFVNLWILPGLRIVIIFLLVFTAARIRLDSLFSIIAAGFLITLSIALLTGTAGRISAILIAILISTYSMPDGLSLPVLFILSSSCLIFLVGTGRFSFWKPEDSLIYHRIGDRENL